MSHEYLDNSYSAGNGTVLEQCFLCTIYYGLNVSLQNKYARARHCDVSVFGGWACEAVIKV